jgi:hypothetical protein
MADKPLDIETDPAWAEYRKIRDQNLQERMRQFNLAAEVQAEGVARAMRRLAQEQEDEAWKNVGNLSEAGWEIFRRSRFGW